MENTIKKTKAMYFAELREMVINAVQDQEQQMELIEFIDKQIDTLEKRKAGTIVKEAVKVEGNKRMAYRLAA